jgi:hypothetical protein
MTQFPSTLVVDRSQRRPSYFRRTLRRTVLSLSSTFRTAGWIGLAVIVVLSLVPGRARPHNALGLPGEYEHLLAYMLTAGALGLAYQKATIRAALLTLLVICAAFLEIGQIWVPGRTGQLIDFGASSIGVGGGLLAAAVINHLVSGRHQAGPPGAGSFDGLGHSGSRRAYPSR